MKIDEDYVVEVLGVFKRDGTDEYWESITDELKTTFPNPCTQANIDCSNVHCIECIFEFESDGKENLQQTLDILEDNPDIITIVNLLT